MYVLQEGAKKPSQLDTHPVPKSKLNAETKKGLLAKKDVAKPAAAEAKKQVLFQFFLLLPISTNRRPLLSIFITSR